jgi:hypothetical protein
MIILGLSGEESHLVFLWRTLLGSARRFRAWGNGTESQNLRIKDFANVAQDVHGEKGRGRAGKCLALPCRACLALVVPWLALHFLFVGLDMGSRWRFEIWRGLAPKSNLSH